MTQETVSPQTDISLRQVDLVVIGKHLVDDFGYFFRGQLCFGKNDLLKSEHGTFYITLDNKLFFISECIPSRVMLLDVTEDGTGNVLEIIPKSILSDCTFTFLKK